jgi:GntR family transcriptional regulator
MAIQHNSPVPLYLQIKEYLRLQINDGVFPIGSRLPSERELAQRFQVSRMTARQALRSLGHEGFADSSAGKGTYVRLPKIDRQLRSLTSFSQEMQQRGLAQSSRVLKAEVAVADYQVAKVLQIPYASEIVTLSRIRLADGTPLSVEHAHLVHDLCRGILEKHDFTQESLYRVLREEYGWMLVWADQTIEARLPLRTESKLLGIDTHMPVLSMNRITFTHKDTPIEYVRSTYRGDRYQLHAVLRSSN